MNNQRTAAPTTKHTPGPWEVVDIGGVAIGVGIDEGGNCFRMIGNTLTKNDPREIDEINANARLISAAPDLLAACEEMLRTLTAPSRELCDITRKELGPWLTMLRTAISIAKGTP